MEPPASSRGPNFTGGEAPDASPPEADPSASFQRPLFSTAAPAKPALPRDGVASAALGRAAAALVAAPEHAADAGKDEHDREDAEDQERQRERVGAARGDVLQHLLH